MRGSRSASVRHGQTVLAVLLLAVGVVGSVHAQETPPAVHPHTMQSPQQRAKQFYDQRSKPQNPEPASNPVQQPARASSKTSGVPAGSVHFVLTAVEFDASAFLTAAELKAVAQPYIGRKVDMADLKAILTGVDALYAKRHITTARALLGSQTIRNGVVHVALVEGRLGKLTVRGNEHTRTSFIDGRISMQPGAVVRPDTLRQDLVYLNRTTNLQVQALLRPGAARGQTDVLLQVTEPPRRSLDAFVDNAGPDSTGSTRIGLQGHMYGLIGVGDTLDASLAHSKGGTDGTLSYSAIVNQRNGRLGLGYSRSQINIVNGAFEGLDITGRSSSFSLNYNQPFIATQAWTFSGVSALSLVRSRTRIGGKQIADTRSTSVALGVSFGHRNATQQWVLTQVVSRVHSQEPLADHNNFLVAKGSFSGIQRLGTSKYVMRLDAGWQYSTSKTLPAAELFQIGGVGSVRGYERGILSAAHGYYLDLELHRPMGTQADVYVFADHGATYGAYPTSRHITGGGLGALFRFRSWLVASLDVAHAFDTNVIPDQDATRVDFRVTIHWQ